MEAFLEVVAAKSSVDSWRHAFEKIWKLTSVRRVTVTVWAVATALTIAIPSCSEQPGPDADQLTPVEPY